MTEMENIKMKGSGAEEMDKNLRAAQVYEGSAKGGSLEHDLARCVVFKELEFKCVNVYILA